MENIWSAIGGFYPVRFTTWIESSMVRFDVWKNIKIDVEFLKRNLFVFFSLPPLNTDEFSGRRYGLQPLSNTMAEIGKYSDINSKNQLELDIKFTRMWFSRSKNVERFCTISVMNLTVLSTGVFFFIKVKIHLEKVNKKGKNTQNTR